MTDRILLAGDSHGNSTYMRLVLQAATDLGIRVVVQLGDFGWWPNTQRFIAGCRKDAKKRGITLLTIDGNHDYSGNGQRSDGGFMGWTAPTDDLRLDPAIIAEPELWHLERGTRLRLADREIVFVGSAVSIDRARRTEGRSWWSTEAISEHETQRIVGQGTGDLLLTHDAVSVPAGIRPTDFAQDLTADLETQRDRMPRIADAVDPLLHVHGHFHKRYTSRTQHGPVIGLDYESTLGLHVLDLARLETTADRLDPLIAAMYWFDSYDDEQQEALLDELSAGDDPHSVMLRHEAALHLNETR